MAICKDANGNVVPCETIKGDFQQSDDLSKGTEMKKTYKPAMQPTRKDPKVYDKLAKEIESGFAESKYGYTGKDLNEYIKEKRASKIYKNPSKNTKQNENLEMIKRGGFIEIGGSIKVPETIKKIETGIDKDKDRDKGETKKLEKDKGSGKEYDPPKTKRSLDFSSFTTSGKPPSLSSTESSVSCDAGFGDNCKPGINKAKRQLNKKIRQSNRQDKREIRKSERNMPKNKPPRRTKFSQGARASSRRTSSWKKGAGIKYNTRSLFR